MVSPITVYQISDGEVRVWRDEGCICIKTQNPHGDPVELSDEEAVELGKLLLRLAE